jgi:hypothetical protein
MFSGMAALGSTNSAADCSALFVGFTATMTESDSSCPCIIGYGSSPSRRGFALEDARRAQSHATIGIAETPSGLSSRSCMPAPNVTLMPSLQPWSNGQQAGS